MRILGFEYPDDCLFDLERDLWCRKHEDGSLIVGITEFGALLSGEFYMCRMKPPGSAVERGGKLGVVELSKSVIALRSPLSGTVIATNPLLADTPGIINQEPYGEGWIVRLMPACLDEESAGLCHGAPLAAAAATRMRLERIALPHIAFPQCPDE